MPLHVGTRRALLGQTAFTPLSLPNLALWLDASDAATLYQDSALTTLAAADADPVGGWKDKSGNCLTADTPAFFGRGYLPVSEGQESDTIYQIDGQFGQIRHAWSREHDGEVLRIKARGMYPIGITPEHEVLRVDGAVVDVLRQEKRASRRPIPVSQFIAEWVPASNLKVGDLLPVAKPALSSHQVSLEFKPGPGNYQKHRIFEEFKRGLTPNEIDHERFGVQPETVRRYFSSFKSHGLHSKDTIANTVVIFDSEWAEIFGWWVAEGSIGRRSDGTPAKVIFSLGPTEKDEAKRLIELLAKKTFTQPYVKHAELATTVVCNCVPLALFLVDNFGTGARYKRLPRWLLEAETHILTAFVRAYCDGDGSVRTPKDRTSPVVEFVTTSTGLVCDLALALMKLGALPQFIRNPAATRTIRASATRSERIAKGGVIWRLRLSGRAVNALYPELSEAMYQREAYLEDEDHFYVRVNEIRREHYTGKVYDFESETHTLGLPFIVHNSRNATQATAGKRPTLKLAIQNGKPVVRFDGVDDFLQTAAFAELSQPNTLFMVAKTTNAASVAQIFCDGIAAGKRHLLEVYPANKYSIYAGVEPEIGGANTNFHVFAAVFNGTSSKAGIDATNLSTVSAGTHGLTGVTLGSSYAGGQYLGGDIQNYLLYAGELSATNIALVVRYLGTSAGVVVS